MLLLLVVVVINYTPVQNYIVHKAAATFSKKLKTKVCIDNIRVDFLNHLSLNGVYIEDQARDTLLYAGSLEVRITDWFIFKDKPVLHYVGLKNTLIHLYRTRANNIWNYEFIEQALSSGSKSADTSSSDFALDLDKISFKNVRFFYDDSWGGEDLDFTIGDMLVKCKEINSKKKLIYLDEINFKQLLVDEKEYKGGKPPRIHLPNEKEIIDTTPFNTDKWIVKINKLTLDSCAYNLTMDDKQPVPGLFDENHLQLRGINTNITDISIVGDTIRGDVHHLAAKDRCGIAIKDMRSKVSVSPVASICDKLYLETEYSKITEYYAMLYKRFPNFLEYIDSVTMVGRLNNAIIDTRDIAYFAPEMKLLPAIVTASGKGRGTVADLNAQNIAISDGRSVLKGDLTMKGLPDIYKTYITFTDCELYTNGEGVFKYAPILRKNKDINIAAIKHAYFKGNYIGYLENFAVDGSLTSNIGAISAKLNIGMPGFNGGTITYNGAIASQKIDLGTLFGQTIVGKLSCNETISGVSVQPENAQLKIDGNISDFEINGYEYKNIITKGTLAKKQFNGSLLVDDPNLAMEFDGGLDYRQKDVQINATAHLLYSNLKKLNITSDEVTTAADFDLNCMGSNIDNFSGYARLYNIDLRRNSRKVAVDSINLNSAIISNDIKELTIKSNILTATITGDYYLTGLAGSVQYYLSKYIPNFIKAPNVIPAYQNLDFSITTRQIDSMLAIVSPSIKGFNNSIINGSLNTESQRLVIDASIPFGAIDNVKFNNTAIEGIGNLESLALNTTIDNVTIGDNFINGSLSLTTAVSRDSINFTVATTTPDTSTSITLNGDILAHKDSLLVSIRPSEFFLSKAHWQIAGGSKIVYAENYLTVNDILLTSGLQKISINTRNQYTDNPITINTENLDIGQLGAWAGLSLYQPEGRLNGNITIQKIFKDLYVETNLNASNVKLSNELVGNINVIGNYDKTKKRISLDPLSGIYRDNSSINTSGYVSFDSTSSQIIHGDVVFNKARVSWASPFLTGLFSQLGGTVDGNMTFRGTSDNPVISGNLTANNVTTKVDYTGCTYTVPEAKITVDNNRINILKTEIVDNYKNIGYLSGYFAHRHFLDFNMNLLLSSPKMEVVKLNANENELFYGNVIASIDSFTVKGPFNNISLHIHNAAPAAKSKLFIPVSTTGDISTYSYVSFKTYGDDQRPVVRRNSDKLSLNIDANLNDLAEVTIVLDPVAGDAITTHGEGNIQLSVPPRNDMRITGIYTINSGTYDFTFKQLFFRQFKLNQGSTINFIGPFFETVLDVNATYSAKVRLADLLNDAEKGPDYQTYMSAAELTDAKSPQTMNVLLHMKGNLKSPLLGFDLELPDKRSVNTYAYTKFNRINQDDRQKFDQVASILLINSLIPSDGIGSNSVITGSINNFSQILSNTASTGLTNLVSKLVGDKQLNVDVKYNSYNLNTQSSQAASAINRNVVKVGVSHPFLDDRLVVEVGSTSDWGRPSSTSTTNNFNITGDFRVQYILNQASGLRLNAFRTSDYDVTLDKNITRSGLGITWRKSFDKFSDLFIKPTQLAQDSSKTKDSTYNQKGTN